MIGVGRRGVPPGDPLSLPSTLEDPGAGWKGGPPGPDNQGGFTPSGPNSFGGPVAVFPNAGQGSPAGSGQPVQYQGPPPGSNTPQYTASPTPSGSSTPGPGPPANVSGAGFPPPPNSGGPPYNGPGPGAGGPFGSPSAGGPPFNRPNSSGPAFGGSHFPSPGGFGGPQFNMPPGSPFGHGPGGHPMGPMVPAGHLMGSQPVDRMEQGFSHPLTNKQQLMPCLARPTKLNAFYFSIIQIIAPVLVESDMFMDAIFASQTTKKDSARKRKRVPSLSTSDATKPEKVQSPDSKSVAPKFYQDTLDEDKDEDKTEVPKKKDSSAETTKTKETNDSTDVEMQEVNDSNETKEAENVIVENKKPPGPGCGPNGPPGVLTILKRKGSKKQLRWKPQESPEEIHYFELDETERVNVSRNSVDMTQMERLSEREGDAFLIARKLNADDLMAEQVPWKPLKIVDDVPTPPDGSGSKEKQIQSDRELTCLRAIYFNRSMIPESPAEPDMLQYQVTDAKIIPLEDANGSPDCIKSFVSYAWPEPRGSPTHQPNVFVDQPFNNFPPNFPYNNQPAWTPPNVIPPAFNGPHNLLNNNAIQPDPINNMNMNQMPPFQQNPNFCPVNGLRNNFNNNFGNDGRMHSGPPQNNPNWFRPVGHQNNWRPPMGNNNNRPRPDWNPRNVCRSFAKGFCPNGDKCQWLHPGINCPPF